MNTWQRALLIVAIVLLGVGEWLWQVRSVRMRLQHDMEAERVSMRHAPRPQLPAGIHAFTVSDIRTFLSEAKHAETMVDPLQRCLAYPDPPHSHWSHESVVAYCRYRFQPTISFAEVQSLIQGGHGDEVDRRFARALHDQQTLPASQGLLDRTYDLDFDNGEFAIRPTLDAWKRASPNSAFALAASGTAYVAMASAARGGKYAGETSGSQFEAMDKLLSQADDDLQRAVKLNPSLTSAYEEMIIAGKLGSSDAGAAAARGMAAAPENYAIREMLMSALEPRWGGSLRAMSELARTSQTQVARNPLLALLLAEEPAYRYDVCDCRSQAVLDADPLVFDQVATAPLLTEAGYAASRHNRSDLSVVYLSEGLRFNPSVMDARIRRNYDLTTFGELAWALADANQLVQKAPSNAGSFDARGSVYEALHDYAHAELDLLASIKLDATDTWPQVEVGNIYVYKEHEWEKGWDIANHLIQTHPEKPYGWILRASIQKDQPRPGIADTARYFLDHFGDDPSLQLQVRQMRDALAKKAAADTTRKSTTPSRG